MAQPVLDRRETAEEFKWKISDLYPTDDAWSAEFDRLHTELDALAGYKGRLGESAAVLLAFLQASDRMEVDSGRMLSYAFRKTDVDTRNATYQEISA